MEENEYRFAATFLKLSNAVLVFYYKKEGMSLGTLAISMPQLGEGSYISSILLGERNIVLTKILAERVARAFKGIALVSTYLPEIREPKAGSTLLKLTQRLLDKAGLK